METKVNTDLSKHEISRQILSPYFFLGVPGPRMNGQSRLERHLAGYESSSTMMSSELETTSFCDSEDDDTMSR